jgi:hypothetical protein
MLSVGAMSPLAQVAPLAVRLVDPCAAADGVDEEDGEDDDLAAQEAVSVSATAAAAGSPPALVEASSAGKVGAPYVGGGFKSTNHTILI